MNADQIENAIARTRMVAGMDKSRIRRDAKLEILRLLETDISASMAAAHL